MHVNLNTRGIEGYYIVFLRSQCMKSILGSRQVLAEAAVIITYMCEGRLDTVVIYSEEEI